MLLRAYRVVLVKACLCCMTVHLKAADESRMMTCPGMLMSPHEAQLAAGSQSQVRDTPASYMCGCTFEQGTISFRLCRMLAKKESRLCSESQCNTTLH